MPKITNRTECVGYRLSKTLTTYTNIVLHTTINTYPLPLALHVRIYIFKYEDDKAFTTVEEDYLFSQVLVSKNLCKT